MLDALGVQQAIIDAELAEMRDVTFAKTSSRSVLGTMNDYQLHSDASRWQAPHASMLDLSLELANVPCGPLEYAQPMELAVAMLGGKQPPKKPTRVTEPTDCPFCDVIGRHEFVMANREAVAFYDRFPVSTGRALIVPKLHGSDFFELSASVQASVWKLVAELKRGLDHLYEPDGYNIGVNVGASAGQTVGHAHVHLIPRYQGDSADPRGGVRWVLPAKAAYWTSG